MMGFWIGFSIAYFLAGALVLRMVHSSHTAVHPRTAFGLGASVYVFFVWPAILTDLSGAGR